MTDFKKKYKGRLTGNNKPKAALPKAGEIWWVSNLDGIKDRPILIVDYDRGRVRYRKCTSKCNGIFLRTPINDYQKAGLFVTTYVDPMIRSITMDSLVRRMGSLSDRDRRVLGV